MSFKLKERSSKVEPTLVLEAQKICEKWLLNVDEYIRRNLDTLTCDNIREVYFALFEELKRWRSNSTGFTGFSEFLIFRVLYHVIGEKFKITQRPRTTTIFKSENYEIGQSVSFNLKFLDGVKRRLQPDIYAKRNGEIISIIQIKITAQQGEREIAKLIESFGAFRHNYPDIKGLLVVLNGEAFPPDKEKRLKDAGYQTEVLQGNHKLISDVLKEFVY